MPSRRMPALNGFAVPASCALLILASLLAAPRTLGQSGLQKVNHIVVVMQENHSFDNYFGALAYAPGSPYHAPALFDRDLDPFDLEREGCRNGDHRCVDGLNCKFDAAGGLHCFNANVDDDGNLVFAFHDARRCVLPDLDRSWFGAHRQANFLDPNASPFLPLNDGFVLVNDRTAQAGNGVENAADDQTMSFYTQSEIPFYYDLASKFAIDDRYFSS